jgi:hypothetical protein
MKVTFKVVGRAHMTVDLPAGSEELLSSMRARLPGDFEDIFFDLGIRSLSEEDFLDQLYTLEVESFKVDPDDSPADSSSDGPMPEGEVPR